MSWIKVYPRYYKEKKARAQKYCKGKWCKVSVDLGYQSGWFFKVVLHEGKEKVVFKWAPKTPGEKWRLSVPEESAMENWRAEIAAARSAREGRRGWWQRLRACLCRKPS